MSRDEILKKLAEFEEFIDRLRSEQPDIDMTGIDDGLNDIVDQVEVM